MVRIAGCRMVISARVLGKPTYYYAEKPHKDDINTMELCCEAEMRTAERHKNYFPAPFFFERVAILSRKRKDYAKEVAICEAFLKFASGHSQMVGPRAQAVRNRLPKAKELLARQQGDGSKSGGGA